MSIPVLVMVSDKHLYALKPFIMQFQRYWGNLAPTDVTIAGYSHPGYTLPENFRFISLGQFRDYPANRYSDSLILALNQLKSEHFVLMLEDFWLIRPVNYPIIDYLFRFMLVNPDILRLDLTTDRAYAQNVREVGTFGYIDLIETPPSSPYQMSFQAGIFNRKLLLSLLEPGLTPWQIEIEGTGKLAKLPYRVLGTRQAPIRYFIAIQGGVLNWQDTPWQVPPSLLSTPDRTEIEAIL